MDIAASIQAVTEEVVLKMVHHVHHETGQKNLCLAGGVALNCVANSKILTKGPFENVWIQPAAGDAGGALGSALSVWHRFLGNNRTVSGTHNSGKSSYLGPWFSNARVKAFLDGNGYPYQELPSDKRAMTVAQKIADGKIVGYMAGRMEFGPRALGARSILGDPRSKETQTVMNLKIKYRESFRPFAPTVLEENVSDYFEMDRSSPYMLFVAKVNKDRCLPPPANDDLPMLDRLKIKRSDIPAVTHLDYTARLQTVSEEDKKDYYDIISAFKDLTGYGVIVNTSFNVRGEPIVCSPEDAYRCFMRTDMDILVMEDVMLLKEKQPKMREKENWQDELELD